MGLGEGNVIEAGPMMPAERLKLNGAWGWQTNESFLPPHIWPPPTSSLPLTELRQSALQCSSDETIRAMLAHFYLQKHQRKKD